VRARAWSLRRSSAAAAHLHLHARAQLAAGATPHAALTAAYHATDEQARRHARSAGSLTPLGSPLTQRPRRTSTCSRPPAPAAQVTSLGIAECTGCTAVTAHVARLPGGGLRVSVANAGDARCVLVRLPCPPASASAADAAADGNGDADAPADGGWCAGEPLSVDHVPSLPSEAARVAAAGGVVARGRVLGVLAVSRAIGDVCLKPSVTAAPHTAQADLPAGQRALLLLFCDGVSAVMNDDQTARAAEAALARITAAGGAGAGGGGGSAAASPAHAGVQAHAPHAPLEGDALAAALAKALVTEALLRGTRDNVTVIAVLL
jgi:hypothetical protein